MIRTIEQQRAAFALEFINAIQPEDNDKIMVHIHKTPIRILQNGLGQALAFLLADSKGNDDTPSCQVYAMIEDWLVGAADPKRPCRVYITHDESSGIMDQLVNGNRNAFMHATEESLALFSWIKKFAEAYLK